MRFWLALGISVMGSARRPAWTRSRPSQRCRGAVPPSDNSSPPAPLRSPALTGFAGYKSEANGLAEAPARQDEDQIVVPFLSLKTPGDPNRPGPPGGVHNPNAVPPIRRIGASMLPATSSGVAKAATPPITPGFDGSSSATVSNLAC